MVEPEFDRVRAASCQGGANFQVIDAWRRRLFDWDLREMLVEGKIAPASVWDRDRARFDYLHLFRHSGRRVTINFIQPGASRGWQT